MVIDASQTFGIPATLIVGHYGGAEVGKLRRKLQAAMVMELNMKRWEVAYMFNRDVRRCQSSVLGIPHSTYQGRGKLVKQIGKQKVHFSPNLMVPLGNQFIWNACLPGPVQSHRNQIPMKPISAKTIRGLDEAGRAELMAFLESQISRVRQVA